MLTLVLVVLGLAKLSLEFRADLVKQLAKAGGTIYAGRCASHATVAWIHGHFVLSFFLLLRRDWQARFPGGSDSEEKRDSASCWERENKSCY